MPKYKITDAVTRKAVTVSGDSAPTDQDAEQIFKDAGLRNEQPSMSMGEMASGAAKNFIPSAINLGKNIATPFLHPIDTATSMARLGDGLMEKIPGVTSAIDAVSGANPQGVAKNKAMADAVGNFYADRYGSLEGFKRAVSSDPAGVMADISVPLTMGGSAAARVPGVVGKMGDLTSAAGRIANPVSLGIKATKALGNYGGKALSEALGVTTGAGGQSIRGAFDAGAQGGSLADAFQSHLRGNAPIEDIVSDARGALGNLRSDRGTQYRAGMGSVSADPTVLDMAPIDRAIAKSNAVKNFKGVDISDSTADIRASIAAKIDQWKQLDPQKYHTAAGFDALKQSIGDIKDTTPYGSPAREVANQAYNAIRAEIVKQAPSYGQTMDNYAGASEQLKDIERTFSLGQGAAVDTLVRKLQSTLRDNVNTSYGRRMDLANVLSQNGAPNLMAKIAGQTLSAPHARGLGYALTGGEVASIPSLLMAGHPATAAAVLPALALQSPRLMGEGAYYAGKALGVAKSLPLKTRKAADAALLAEILGAQKNNSEPSPLGFGQLVGAQ